MMHSYPQIQTKLNVHDPCVYPRNVIQNILLSFPSSLAVMIWRDRGIDGEVAHLLQEY